MPRKLNNVMLGHGGGGKMTGSLIRDVTVPKLDRGLLGGLPDSVVINNFGKKLAYTTDSYVVSPIFFPGGDIGSLSVHGTCNDLACSGAKPLFLSLAFILEEGLGFEQLEAVVASIDEAARESGVEIVTGDTKVVPKGSADGIFINTSGIGMVLADPVPAFNNIEEGDLVWVSGSMGNHGMTVMLSRAEFSFDFNLRSDSAPIWPIVERLIELGMDLKFLRDPTRGGLSAVLNEIAQQTGLCIEVDESRIPVDDAVVAAADMLGIDPLQSANEGKIVAVVAEKSRDKLIEIAGKLPLAASSSIIGRVTRKTPSKVVLHTSIGGTRIMAEPSGELLPRIC